MGMHSESVHFSRVSVSFYTIIPSSLFTPFPGACTPLICSSQHGSRRRRRVQPPTLSPILSLVPQYRTKNPHSPATNTPQHPNIRTGVLCVSASQPANMQKKNPPSYKIHPHSIFLLTARNAFFYMAEPAPFCTCVKYCLLVVFHAAMYFSMQLV
jgi:hypothetical protein